MLPIVAQVGEKQQKENVVIKMLILCTYIFYGEIIFTATKHCKRKTKEIELISVISFTNNGTQAYYN